MGSLYGWFTPRGLSRLVLPTPNSRRQFQVLHSAANDSRVWRLQAALERYFTGVREDFSGIPVDLAAGTPFRQRVWRAAVKTEWGTVATYGQLAKAIGKPKAARAVGQALGANPVPILVPCHRFLAAGGLGGFGAGLEWKRELLKIEGGHAR